MLLLLFVRLHQITSYPVIGGIFLSVCLFVLFVFRQTQIQTRHTQRQDTQAKYYTRDLNPTVAPVIREKISINYEETKQQQKRKTILYGFYLAHNITKRVIHENGGIPIHTAAGAYNCSRHEICQPFLFFAPLLSYVILYLYAHIYTYVYVYMDYFSCGVYF